MEDRSALPRPDQIAFGIAAASALIAAACLSGLPSSSCAAIAQTYVLAIKTFGAVAFAAISFAYPYASWSWKPQSLASEVINLTFVGILAVFFLFCASAGLHNLQIATKHCLIGSDTELASQIHQEIKLWDIGVSSTWPDW